MMAERQEAAVQKQMKNILLIEDEDHVMRIIQALLERMGYHVLNAMTGQEAVNITQSFDGDIGLAFLDISLPDMEGKTLYPLICKARPNLKVIVCSGYSLDGPVREILEAGADDFIQKPFTKAMLSEKLDKLLNNNH